MAWAEAYFRTNWHPDASSCLATIGMGRKRGDCTPFFVERAGSPSSTMWPGPRPTSVASGILIHPAVWRQQTWVENWGAVPLLGREAGSPPNTMWPGLRPTSMPSFILIHPTVWPQYTRVTDRQTGHRTVK